MTSKFRYRLLPFDAALEVGAATETVTVTYEVATLKTESAEQSTVIETDRINDLP